MTSPTSQHTLTIAIIGAGIAGLTAAIALQKHPLINVVLYDKATELKEIGASIALGPNGLRTLQRLGLEDVIGEGNGFRGPERVGMIYRHVSFFVFVFLRWELKDSSVLVAFYFFLKVNDTFGDKVP